jgi:hypothetical protein
MVNSAFLGQMVGDWASGVVVPSSNLLPHKYWRMVFYATHAPLDLYVALAEVQLRETAGTPAVMAPLGVATASSFYPDSVSWEAPKAVDGLANTEWISNQNMWYGGWWKFTFTTAQVVEQLMLQAYNTTPGAGQMPKTWMLQWSDDDIAWQDAMYTANVPAWAASELRLYTLPASYP